MNSKSLTLALVVMTLLALGLRLRGIDHGLPTAVEQDCKIPRQVELLREGGERWRRDPEFRWYPLLVAHIARLWPEAQSAAPDAPLDLHLAAAARPHVQVRITVALLASLIVPATWLLASWFVGRGWAFFAAALVAVSLLDLNFSQQSRPHAVSGTVFLAAVLAAVHLRRSGGWQALVLAVAGAALAIGCLQSGFLVLPALFTALLASCNARRRWFAPRAVVAALAVALAVPVFYPFAVWGEPLEHAASARVAQQFIELHTSPRWELDIGDHRIFLDQFRGAGLPVVLRSLWSYEPALLVLLAVAAAAWLVRLARRPIEPASADRGCRGDLWVVLAFAVPYALVVLAYERTYERFVIPLLPYLALAATAGLREVARRMTLRPAAITALVCTVLALPIWACWRLGTIRSAAHTTSQAADWLSAHVDAGDDVALWPQLDLPLCREPAGLVSWTGPIDDAFFWPWARYQARLPGGHGPAPLRRLRWWKPQLVRMADDPASYVREQGGDWLVMEVYADNRVYPGATRAQDVVRATGELALRVSPDGRPDYSEHPLGYQDETSVPAPHFLARVLRARSTGPVIEVYRLKPD